MLSNSAEPHFGCGIRLLPCHSPYPINTPQPYNFLRYLKWHDFISHNSCFCVRRVLRQCKRSSFFFKIFCPEKIYFFEIFWSFSRRIRLRKVFFWWHTTPKFTDLYASHQLNFLRQVCAFLNIRVVI